MIGSLLTQVRLTFGWSKRELQDRFATAGIEITHQVISKWEGNRGNPCKPPIVNALCQIYREAAEEHNKTAVIKIAPALDSYQLGTAVLAASGAGETL